MKRYLYEDCGLVFESLAACFSARDNRNKGASVYRIDTERLTVEVVPEPRLVCQYAATKDGPWRDYRKDKSAAEMMAYHKSKTPEYAATGYDHNMWKPHARIVEKCGYQILRVVETWSPPEVTYRRQFFMNGEWETFDTCGDGETREVADARFDGNVSGRCDIPYRIIDSNGKVVRKYAPPEPVTYKVQYFTHRKWNDDWTLKLGIELSRADADKVFDAGVREFPDVPHRIIDSTGKVVREYAPPKPERWRVESSGYVGSWNDNYSAVTDRAEDECKSRPSYVHVRRESDNKVIATYRWVPGRVEEERHE